LLSWVGLFGLVLVFRSGFPGFGYANIVSSYGVDVEDGGKNGKVGKKEGRCGSGGCNGCDGDKYAVLL